MKKERTSLAPFVWVLWLFSSSCGYHFGQGGALSSYRTITVPYIEGDWNGQLTSALIQEVSGSGTFTYRESCGRLTLCVAVIEYTTDDVGFRYECSQSGNSKTSVVPDETRLNILVEVKVIDNASNQVLLGPARISAYVDFDHNYYDSRDASNVFSMGQLTDYNSAYDTAQLPLSRKIAKKIMDYLNAQW